MKIASSLPSVDSAAAQEYASAQPNLKALVDLVEWVRPDQSAATAIAQLKADESLEDLVSSFRPPVFGGGDVVNVWAGLAPKKSNKLTGEELMGYLLEGVMDPGNELNELKQFQQLRNDPDLHMDSAANRVMAVVDKYVAKMQAEGRTSLSPEEKAQMTSEMATAAKPISLWEPSIYPIKHIMEG